MNHTLVSNSDTNTHPVVNPNIAVGYKYNARKRTYLPQSNSLSGPSAVANVISCAHDLGRYAQALLGNVLLQPRTLNQMWAPSVTPAADTLIYGLGWFCQPNPASGPSPKIVWHYGWLLNGYSALLMILPEQKMALVLLANSEGLAEGQNLIAGDVRTSPFARSFLEIMLRP
jgi:CubicO group peptidase (beta-lactamase class C family)